MSLTMVPGRQKAFHFTASNCIGCHSCEAACSEKNGLPAHIAWRKVGFIESGAFPDYRRINVSMACNHCDDPVCLKGCPTRAYVKYADTGAVVQDSNVCFGCQYCTWVCPYGAPAFNPDTGTVSKCNFCVDRQAEGREPACVEACLGHALAFGERDGLLAVHGAADRTLPGFPDPEITRPNVRFRFDGGHAPRYGRGDGDPLAYVDHGHGHRPDPGPVTTRIDWSRLRWSALRSGETPLMVFTLIAQGVVGAFAVLYALSLGPHAGAVQGAAGGLLGVMAALLGHGLFTSTMHLGRPRYFYRAMNNLRHSWVSREILFVGGFMPLLVTYALARGLGLLGGTWLTALGGAASLFGMAGIYCMVRIYRIPARPYWHHVHTGTLFAKSGLALGPLFLGTGVGGWSLVAGAAPDTVTVLHWCAGIALWAVMSGVGANFDLEADLERQGGEGRAAIIRLKGDHGAAWLSRVALALAASVVLCGALAAGAVGMTTALVSLALALTLAGEVLERSLFYRVVVPTSMSGGYFLKNRRFEDLARETGLARDPTVGVAPDPHHGGDGAHAPEPPEPEPAEPEVPGSARPPLAPQHA